MSSTHAVVVGALIQHQSRLLLLLRKNAPFVWAPPGGRLNPEEDPFDGLRREVREECSLDIEFLDPPLAIIWYGIHNNAPHIAIFLFADIVCGNLSLNDEHSQSGWFDREGISALHRGTPGLFLSPDIYHRALRIASLREQWLKD